MNIESDETDMKIGTGNARIYYTSITNITIVIKFNWRVISHFYFRPQSGNVLFFVS